MPDLVTVNVDVRHLQRAIHNFDQRIDAVDIEGIVGQTVLTAMDDLVESRGNGTWADFSEVTYKLHPNRKGAKILQGPTGELVSFQIKKGPGFVEVGSPAHYAEYHQLGTKKLRGWVTSDDHGIPQRDITGIDVQRTLEDCCTQIVEAIVR